MDKKRFITHVLDTFVNPQSMMEMVTLSGAFSVGRRVSMLANAKKRLRIINDLKKIDTAIDVQKAMNRGYASAKLMQRRKAMISSIANNPGLWNQHIDGVIASLTKQGAGKTFLLGEDQRVIIRYLSSNKNGWSQFTQFRPPELSGFSPKTCPKYIQDATFEFNKQLIRRLYERGYQFKSLGIGHSTQTVRRYLKAELQVLEGLGGKVDVVPIPAPTTP